VIQGRKGWSPSSPSVPVHPSTIHCTKPCFLRSSVDVTEREGMFVRCRGRPHPSDQLLTQVCATSSR